MDILEHDIVLQSNKLRVQIDLANGAKIRSLVSLRTGKEFFYQDSRRSFDGSRGYSYHDIGGMDECFPSVAACRGQTNTGTVYDYPDHGYLWQTPWKVVTSEPHLTLSCFMPALNCTFKRQCCFETDETLLLNYRITNQGRAGIPFVYSAHPLLAADEHTQVQFPDSARRAFVAGQTAAPWIELPGPRPELITGPFSLHRHTAIKLYTESLTTGDAVVTYPDSDERLRIAFDTEKLPHLGYLSCQGNDNLGDGHFIGECLLAFEPTSGIGDDLDTTIQTGTLKVLAPGDTYSFWIRMTVEAASEGQP